MKNQAKQSFGEHIRARRELKKLPIRKVAALLDIDPSTLSKIERGERQAPRELIPLFAKALNENIDDLLLILLSDKVAMELLQETNSDEILKVSEEKIEYLRNKSLEQGSLDI